MTDASLHVRTGTADDVHEVMRLALACCEENGLRNPSPAKLLNDIYPALTLQGGIMGLIGEPGGPVEAGILLRIEPLWYTDEPSLVERAIFVDSKFRAAKGGRASRLCEFAKDVQAQLGIPLVIGILSSTRTEGKVRLYERHFGQPKGAYWIFPGGTGQHRIAAE
jgi:hypothetical protein